MVRWNPLNPNNPTTILQSYFLDLILNMKNILRKFLVSILLLTFAQANYATHIVGGEMNYECLGNNQYEIQLTVFRDCINGIPDFDDPASISVFYYDIGLDSFILDSFNLSLNVGQLFIPVINNDTLDPFLSNPCLVIPPDVCVNTTTYTSQLNLPFRPGGYLLAYQRCCRNETILNIVTPDDVGATYTARITPESLNACNNNAVFNEWPPIYICVNEPINFDHSATDIDGDSLVYRLCTPFGGADPDNPMPQPINEDLPPFDTVVWVSPPYSNQNIMGGDPLAINSESGFMTGVPNTIGQFVVGVCVDEYRDGEFLSTTRRDFQYNVGVCGSFTSSFFVPEVSCDGLNVFFDNQSAVSEDFTWFFNDPNNPGATSTITEPTYTYSDTGTYTVMLIAEPNSATCADTSFGTFSIYEPSLAPDFEFDILDCNDPFSISLTDNSTDTVFNITNWSWEINNSTFSNNQNPPDYSGNNNELPLNVSLTITNEKGCEETIDREVNIGVPLNYQNQFLSCEILESTTLSVSPISPTDIVTFTWEPAAAIISGQNTGTPTVDLTIGNVFYFTATDAQGCIVEDSIVVMNEGADLMLNAIADPDTIVNGTSSQLDAFGDGLLSFEWFPDGTLDNNTISNPLATPEETTEYTVVATDANGCQDTAVVLVVLVNLECEEPFLFMPNAFSPNGDGENDVLYVEGNTIDEMELAIYNRWGQKVFESFDKNNGWDGYFNNELLEPDVYGYYLKIRCFNGDDYFKKGNINLIR